MKQFTLENLTKDCACGSGMEFVTPIIEAGKSVPQALKDAGHVDWISWAVVRGYDLSEIRSENFFWDDNGYITATAGDYGTAIAGYRGTAIAGYMGTATAGECGTAIAGVQGTATAGDSGTATAGECGTAIAGVQGTATAGDSGTATAGHRGTAIAGDSGTATVGYRGTATAGDNGKATAGEYGTATAGEKGTIQIKYYKDIRYRIATGYIGENGLKPNTPYRVDNDGNFYEVTDPVA